MNWKVILIVAGIAFLAGCGKTDDGVAAANAREGRYFTLEDVARLLSAVPLEAEQMGEVHDAATASSANGYDEEYLMRDVFSSPGAGVGDSQETKAGKKYARPLRELLLQAALATKADDWDAQALLDSLAASDVQIYWPYSDLWDGMALPVVTFDPGNPGDSLNVGYLPTGDKVLVDEQMARERPVWVVSNNSDAGFTSLEMLRRQDPSWGQGGGDIVIKPRATTNNNIRTLILRSFQSHRQFDSWFAGASEFFVKAGSIKNMTFSKESELLDYRPEVTDFMIVIKRSQVNTDIPFNALLVSEWDKTLSAIGFMVTEDDGGTVNSWKCTASGKYNSKTYGIELSLPVNSRDDIVWRGSLSRNYLEKHSGEVSSFGDIDLVLEFI
ncbi:MAG: hypothetical protein J5745_05650 [Bacteroidales bacterium]|nr:hypothetical protein [Bacteroidales bacterium]